MDFQRPARTDVPRIAAYSAKLVDRNLDLSLPATRFARTVDVFAPENGRPSQL